MALEPNQAFVLIQQRDTEEDKTANKDSFETKATGHSPALAKVLVLVLDLVLRDTSTTGPYSKARQGRQLSFPEDQEVSDSDRVIPRE